MKILRRRPRRDYDEDVPPNEIALIYSKIVSRRSQWKHGLRVYSELPSRDGSIIVSWRFGDRAGHIECYNDGEAVAATEGGDCAVRVWTVADMESLDVALREIREHLKGDEA